MSSMFSEMTLVRQSKEAGGVGSVLYELMVHGGQKRERSFPPLYGKLHVVHNETFNCALVNHMYQSAAP
jgi:hypothetical protein